MIIETKNLQSVCKKILGAVDTSSTQKISEILELSVEGKSLMLSVTNREYYVSVALDIGDYVGDFKAVVYAQLFLNLISNITTSEVEMTTNDNVLFVKANGTYKFPMVYDTDKLIELPKIEIGNETNSFDIESSKLLSILNFNSKEVNKDSAKKASMKMYYLDEIGCVTYTCTSACVNSFSLNTPIKLILNPKVVKLFKLFDDGAVKFTIGYDSVGGVLQQKIRFENNNVVLTSIMNSDDNMLNSFPVDTVRGRVSKNYSYSVVLKRSEVIEALNRILLFRNPTSVTDGGILEFGRDGVTIYDMAKDNNESVTYSNSVLDIDSPIVVMMDLLNLKNTLDGCTDEFVSIGLGDSQTVVITRGNVKNLLSQLA